MKTAMDYRADADRLRRLLWKQRDASILTQMCLVFSLAMNFALLAVLLWMVL